VASVLAPCTEREDVGSHDGTPGFRPPHRQRAEKRVSSEGGRYSWRRSSEISGRKANGARQLNNGG